MNVLMISTDRTVFAEGSAVRKRFIEYGTLVTVLHIIVFTAVTRRAEALAPNVFLHPTNSRSRFAYITDAMRIGKGLPRPDLVTAQDPFETGIAAWRIAKHQGAKLELQIHTDFLNRHFAFHSVPNLFRVI